jgi:hypothetical protein
MEAHASSDFLKTPFSISSPLLTIYVFGIRSVAGPLERWRLVLSGNEDVESVLMVSFRFSSNAEP